MTERTLDVNLHPSLREAHPVTGILAIRGELSADNRAGAEEWHLHEHLLERVSTPGFLRGRRCVTPLDDVEPGRTAFLVVYEADTVETFGSEEYLRRLDQPTPLTRRMVTTTENGRRSAGRVQASVGRGVGQVSILAEYRLDADGGEAAMGTLADEVLPELSAHREVLAARACRSEDAITAAKDTTSEGSRSQSRTTGGGGFALVDVTDATVADELAGWLRTRLEGITGLESPIVAGYRLQMAITDLDC